MNKIINFIKKNWLIIIISILFFGIMFYTTTHSSYASDDYPYSLLYRGTQRITNVIQIIKNQISDYRTIAGRIVTNGLGQFILMFPRWVFAILNASVTLLSSILTYLIIKEFNKDKKINIMVLPLIMALFFIADPTKYLVYWVMGSANYIFMMPLLLLFILLIKKFGLFKYPIITGLFIGAVASFHESLLVFYIIYIAANIIYDLLRKEKLNKWYIFYIVMLILASLFVFLSPGNRIRSTTWYPAWNEMTMIEKFTTTIPTVSKKMFGMDGIHNLIPLIFTGTILYSLFKKKDSIANLLIVSTIVIYALSLLTNDGWLFLIYSGLLFISEAYLHIKNKNETMILNSISFYAVVYAMIITPEYAAGRPNYFMYWYMIIIIGSIINEINKKQIKLIASIIISLFALLTAGREIYIYHEIGKVVAVRNLSIQISRDNNLSYVAFQKIPDKFTYYQMEPNTPGDEYYWAKEYFVHYYHLNENTKIILVD